MKTEMIGIDNKIPVPTNKHIFCEEIEKLSVITSRFINHKLGIDEVWIDFIETFPNPNEGRKGMFIGCCFIVDQCPYSQKEKNQ